ncbi:hypothetical protein [Streptomyces sp. HNM0574]|uniref:hypothetical protein n=1 Tax=Streptomyces sp. HNM0574 TaxID=2714954 RepID=UPI001469E221|nr:hypothetical protein [Streptomyces sp. HNM0574]NLU67973.1 hypothetical protein [Streptomyces sp. HNM0574]
MLDRLPGQEPGPAPEHRTATTERGSFLSAHCSCGWRGPARRARETARADAASHAGEPGP